LYENHLQSFVEKGQITSLNLAFSRADESKIYVGDLIARDGLQIVQLLKKGAVIYICGSLAMQQSVLDELEKACKSFAKKSLNHFQKKGQVKMDCY
jgi:sulfite reductase (NADPH) flavoprotein alpha-component